MVCLNAKPQTKLTGFVLDIANFCERGVFQDIGIMQVAQADNINATSVPGHDHLELVNTDAGFSTNLPYRALEDGHLAYYSHTSGSLWNAAKILPRTATALPSCRQRTTSIVWSDSRSSTTTG